MQTQAPQGETANGSCGYQGRRLGAIGRSVGRWIGDCLRFGNARYGEKYVRTAKVTGYDVQTLANMVYVAPRVDASRRRENFSGRHHAEVASLPAHQQDQWLARAEDGRLSVHDLRRLLSEARRRDVDEWWVAGGAWEHAAICPTFGHALGPGEPAK